MLLELIKILFLQVFLLLLRVCNVMNRRHHKFLDNLAGSLHELLLRVMERHIKTIIIVIEVMMNVLWLFLLNRLFLLCVPY